MKLSWKRSAWVTILIIPFSSFSWGITFITPGNENKAQKDTTAKLIIQLNKEYQTIEGFGASDCWTTQYIGQWADLSKKNQIADYLFSTKMDQEGNPIGIGLSMWRFNIGAGSKAQGDSSGIPSDYRRSECFLLPNGTYDWTRQAGQRWFMKAAKKRGVKDFIAFSISPPVQFTINGKAHGLSSRQFNLQPAKQADFADFLTRVLEHFNAIGMPFRYLSAFNEPQWNWGKSNSQEGTGATNEALSAFIRTLDGSLIETGLSTKLALGEAATWEYLYTKDSTGQGDQLNQFFNPASANYIGDIQCLAPVYSAHSYFTTCPDDSIVSIRKKALAAKSAIAPSLQLWQSEFGILGNICNQYSGHPKNTGIDYGLYVAKVIHHDLTITNVSSWQWWLAVNTYNYSDGLVYINDLNGGYDLESMKKDGRISDSKQLWCLGNFSRFIRPGMIRINAAIDAINNSVKHIKQVKAAGSQMISAYKNPLNKAIVIVIVNMEPEAKSYSMDSSALHLNENKFLAYTTDVHENMRKSTMPAGEIIIPGKSVTTLVGHYE